MQTRVELPPPPPTMPALPKRSVRPTPMYKAAAVCIALASVLVVATWVVRWLM